LKLEIGCGNGINRIPEHNIGEITWLQAYGGKDTIAIDNDINVLEKARSNIKNGTQFYLMDARNVQFPNGYFSVIHEQGVLHHVTDYKYVLTEASRLLCNNGKLELFETVDNFPLYALARRAVGKWNGYSIESYFKSNELIKLLNTSGFEVSRIEYYYQPLWIDILGYFIKGQLPYWKQIMQYRFFISKLLNVTGLGKYFCCHISIISYKKEQ
jgi:ubiquinone/menaquinone biosynthesis C-methylase UbiE